MSIADAEKRPGNKYWTIYDGHGGVYRAQRDRTSGLWHAVHIRDPIVYSGRTLRDVRARIVNFRCRSCGERDQHPTNTTWQQWQCDCCGSWNDR